MPADGFPKVIQVLMDLSDANNEDHQRKKAFDLLNVELGREGFGAFYAEDRQCYLKTHGIPKILKPFANPHRPFSTLAAKKKETLIAYRCSEDDLIEDILLPLLRQLGFYRITSAGHKDMALDYGKDIWMKYMLPTQHMLYFGIQVKKGKLDAAGMSITDNANFGEIQTTLSLSPNIFYRYISNYG